MAWRITPTSAAAAALITLAVCTTALLVLMVLNKDEKDEKTKEGRKHRRFERHMARQKPQPKTPPSREPFTPSSNGILSVGAHRLSACRVPLNDGTPADEFMFQHFEALSAHIDPDSPEHKCLVTGYSQGLLTSDCSIAETADNPLVTVDEQMPLVESRMEFVKGVPRCVLSFQVNDSSDGQTSFRTQLANLDDWFKDASLVSNTEAPGTEDADQ